MELTVNYMGAAQFEAIARGHRVYCDQPLDNGGADEAMTPPEFLLASIGTCAAYYAVQYLLARNLPARELKVRVAAEKAFKPARLSRFRIDVEAPGVDDPKDHEGLRRSVDKCLVKQTLVSPPEFEIAINPGVAGHAPAG
jgi:uncharacterized OsmC-like protein